MLVKDFQLAVAMQSQRLSHLGCETKIDGQRLSLIAMQRSQIKDHNSKIRGTVTRLREFGRTPKRLYYVTSKLIPHIDVEEENT